MHAPWQIESTMQRRLEPLDQYLGIVFINTDVDL